jgi:hypothetical protein
MSSTSVTKIVVWMIAAIVAVVAFIGLLIAGHAWLHTLQAEDREWFLVAVCIPFASSFTVAFIDRRRRVPAGCASALFLSGVILVLTAGLGRCPTRGRTAGHP